MAARKAASSPKGGGAAARSEASAKPKTFKFEGLDLELPAKLPFRTMRHVKGDMGLPEVIAFVSDILGDKQMDQVWELDIDVERGTELINEIIAEYGMGLGESNASAGS